MMKSTPKNRMKMTMPQCSEMTVEDIDAALDLWHRCEGMGLSDADQPEALKSFLQRNPGLSFSAIEDGELIGTCLCGTDGRRGYLYHLAVDARCRKRGIGSELVERTLGALRRQGIHKCHIMVYAVNQTGLAFWQQEGWVRRPEIVLMSRDVPTLYGEAV